MDDPAEMTMVTHKFAAQNTEMAASSLEEAARSGRRDDRI
jgi:hypothetical protein